MGVSKYEEDFKRDVVYASYAGTESIVSVSRRFGVSQNTIYTWRRLYGRDAVREHGGGVAFIPVGVAGDPAYASPAAERIAPGSEEPRHDYAVTVMRGVDRKIAVSGAFSLSDLVSFVRSVAL